MNLTKERFYRSRDAHSGKVTKLGDEDLAQGNEVCESIDEDWSKDESNLKEMQVFEMLKKLYKYSMKKKKTLQMKMKFEEFSGKFKVNISYILGYAQLVRDIEV